MTATQAPAEAATILVVEDNDSQRESLGRLLATRGHEVAVVPDGARALEYLRDAPLPGLVLLDIDMPVMNGIELRKRMLQNPDWAAIPVIITSALAADYRAEDSLRAVEYFPKPYHLRLLLDVIQETLDPTPEERFDAASGTVPAGA